MARLRVCRPDGSMDLAYGGEPGEGHGRSIPWFEMPRRASATQTIICGHWSVQGLRLDARLIMLDTGCVWGNPLTAVRLSDRTVFQSK